MFKKGQVVKCINPGNNASLVAGKEYEVVEGQDNKDYVRIKLEHSVNLFYADRFILVSKEKQEKQEKQEEEAYDLKLSSPNLINYRRMYYEVMVNGTRVAKVTIKVKGQVDQYVLLVHEDILRKARVQEGGQAILDLLHYFGITLGRINRTLTISEWASAYSLVKKLVKLPIKSELKGDTIVTVKPLEV